MRSRTRPRRALRRSRPPGRGGRAPAVPAVRPAARPARATSARGTTATSASPRREGLVSAPDERDELRDQLTPAVELAEPTRRSTCLRDGELTVEGRLVDASNATLYCAASRRRHARVRLQAGGRASARCGTSRTAPWPSREIAAYAVSAASGWGIVPPTVHREPARSVPAWCSCGSTYRTRTDLRAVLRGWRTQLRQIVVFDAVINNADRKGGHLLPTADGHLYAVDHGVSFHVEEKLRTILWNWAGETLPDDCADAVLRLRADLDGDPRGRARRVAHSRRGPRHPPAARPADRHGSCFRSRVVTGRRRRGRRGDRCPLGRDERVEPLQRGPHADPAAVSGSRASPAPMAPAPGSDPTPR